jgi:hypothetical protein
LECARAGVRGPGKGVGLEVVHHHLRDQRGAGAAAGAAQGARPLRVPDRRAAAGRRSRLQVSLTRVLLTLHLPLSHSLDVIDHLQTAAEADQELGRVAHRPRLQHGQNLQCAQTGAANRHDERLPQLPHYLAGE